jgi:hypothetical protein
VKLAKFNLLKVVAGCLTGETEPEVEEPGSQAIKPGQVTRLTHDHAIVAIAAQADTNATHQAIG